MTPDPSSRCLNLLPFGIPTLVIAEDPRLLTATAAAYAHWTAEAPFTEPALELRLETSGTSAMGVCLDIKVEGSRLILDGRGARGEADAASGKAHGIVPHGLAGDAHAFADVIDTLLLFLLARRGRTPVHASAFVLGDRGVLLAGPSGSGKSTLALAAAKQGYAVLSDDMVFVQREPRLTVWGFPRPAHLLPDDAPAGEHAIRLRNGKRKAAVPIATPALSTDSPILITLHRGEEPRLEPIGYRDALDALMKLDAGFDLLEDQSRLAANELCSPGAWRLTLSKNPAEALALLVERFAAD